MKLTHILLIIASMAAAIIAAGCQGLQNGSIPDTSSAFKGTEGLKISFFEGAPPESVLAGSIMNVALLLENKGAASIDCKNEGCGNFLVFAKEPIQFLEENGLEKAVKESEGLLSGKESYASGGRAAYAVGKTIMVSPDTKSTTALVFAAACYPYETKLTTRVCIPTAPYTVPEEKRVCKLEELRFQSQGAPVAIRKIVQNKFLTIENNKETVKPNLRVYVENAGKGIVLDSTPEALAKACTNTELGKEETKIVSIINVESAEVSGVQLECNSGRPFTLTGKNDKDFIECVAAQGQGFKREEFDNNFVATLSIKLRYGYQTAASTEVEIQGIKEDEASKIQPPTIPDEKPPILSEELPSDFPPMPQFPPEDE